MTPQFKILYAFDPLCGWCYGLIPAMRHFVSTHPDVQIDVMPGGLFTGTPPRPYASLIGHIRTAEVHLERVTGQRPSETFHAFIAQNRVIDTSSERPSHAILQVKKIAPDKALAFAHRLQELHYEQGADLNTAEVYNQVTAELGLPNLDTQQIMAATLEDPMVAEAYTRCARLGPQGYPTIFVATPDDEVIGAIPSTYDPQAFVARVNDLVAAYSREGGSRAIQQV